MFETVLASMGVGSSRIDLVLDREYVHIGEQVTGEIIVYGGKSEQTIEGLSVYFMMASVHAKRSTRFEKRVATIQVTDEAFTIHREEEKRFAFQFTCPNRLPITSVNTSYYFDTNLEIYHGIDSHDRDYVRVLNSPTLENFLAGLRHLGLKSLWEGVIDEEEGYSQIFEFKPTTYFYGACQSITFYLKPVLEQGRLQGQIGIDVSDDRSAITHLFQLSEQTTPFIIGEETLATPETIAQKLKDTIQSKIKTLHE